MYVLELISYTEDAQLVHYNRHIQSQLESTVSVMKINADTLYDVPDCPDLTDTHHHHCNICTPSPLICSISISTSAGNHTTSKLQKNQPLNSLHASTNITCRRKGDTLYREHFLCSHAIPRIHMLQKRKYSLQGTLPVPPCDP
jgi:hypothetical protein